MEHKILEIRDRITYIPVLAIKMEPADETEFYYLRREGYIDFAGKSSIIVMYRLDTGKSAIAPYRWATSSRTLSVAHEYIEKHFEELKSGDVVDVEYILGETDKSKTSERFVILQDEPLFVSLLNRCQELGIEVEPKVQPSTSNNTCNTCEYRSNRVSQRQGKTCRWKCLKHGGYVHKNEKACQKYKRRKEDEN